MVKPIAIEFDGHTLAGVLFDDKAPDICNRIWQALPLEGQTTNTIWSGDMLRLWVEIPEPGRRSRASRGREGRYSRPNDRVGPSFY